ncbi:MAG TPA: CYTH domain-containing protein [Candidatus Paceibacterota bacterium]
MNKLEKTIEVELRGILTEVSYVKLKIFLEQNGKHMKSFNREMYLFRDYPSYSEDFVGRKLDIRLRNTDGDCEIMLKEDIGGAREEVSLKLVDHDLNKVKRIMKGLGIKEAIWMQRNKEIYEYKGIHFDLTRCPPSDILYFEAEMNVSNVSEVQGATNKITSVAKEIGLEVLSDEETRVLIDDLDRKANKLVQI